ncbi:MAG: hypothetical protein EZS28_054577, partial [Streblomastix strix]
EILISLSDSDHDVTQIQNSFLSIVLSANVLFDNKFDGFEEAYTVTEVSRDQLLGLAYTPYDLDAFKIYIIDDIVNKLVMFNMHLRQKGFIDVKQYVLSMSESIDPKRTLLFPIMILYDFNTDPIQDIPSAYLTVADTDNPSRWHIHISSELKADKFVNYYLSGSYFV